MQLAVIQCRFQISENTPTIEGLAICFDADTSITFIYPDGKPYLGAEVWNYTLLHYRPWALYI